jgi:hypothetical protein
MDALHSDLMDYIERYRGNVPRLECEREAIATALLHAWRQERYAQVIQLADVLAYLAGRRDNADEGEHLLRLGIEASRYSTAFFAPLRSSAARHSTALFSRSPGRTRPRPG